MNSVINIHVHSPFTQEEETVQCQSASTVFDLKNVICSVLPLYRDIEICSSIRVFFDGRLLTNGEKTLFNEGFHDHVSVRVLREPTATRLDLGVVPEKHSDRLIWLKGVRDHFLAEGKLDIDSVKNLLESAYDTMMEWHPKSTYEVEEPAVVFGDIHGQFHDLVTMLKRVNCPDDLTKNYVFLGDYVDRGSHSTEVLFYLLCLKLAFPDNFHLLRGNHETESQSKTHSMSRESTKKYSEDIWEQVNRLYCSLPLAITLSACHGRARMLCMHGGIGAGISRVRDLTGIVRARKKDVPEQGPLTDCLWADPDRKAFESAKEESLRTLSNPGPFDLVDVLEADEEYYNPENITTRRQSKYMPNTQRHIGTFFEEYHTRLFLANEAYVAIIRAHEVCPTGCVGCYPTPKTGFPSVWTVFSAPNYCGYANTGSFLVVEDGKMRAESFEHSECPQTNLETFAKDRIAEEFYEHWRYLYPLRVRLLSRQQIASHAPKWDESFNRTMKSQEGFWFDLLPPTRNMPAFKGRPINDPEAVSTIAKECGLRRIMAKANPKKPFALTYEYFEDSLGPEAAQKLPINAQHAIVLTKLDGSFELVSQSGIHTLRLNGERIMHGSGVRLYHNDIVTLVDPGVLPEFPSGIRYVFRDATHGYGYNAGPKAIVPPQRISPSIVSRRRFSNDTRSEASPGKSKDRTRKSSIFRKLGSTAKSALANGAELVFRAGDAESVLGGFNEESAESGEPTFLTLDDIVNSATGESLKGPDHSEGDGEESDSNESDDTVMSIIIHNIDDSDVTSSSFSSHAGEPSFAGTVSFAGEASFAGSVSYAGTIPYAASGQSDVQGSSSEVAAAGSNFQQPQYIYLEPNSEVMDLADDEIFAELGQPTDWSDIYNSDEEYSISLANEARDLRADS